MKSATFLHNGSEQQIPGDPLFVKHFPGSGFVADVGGGDVEQVRQVARVNRLVTLK